MEKTFSDLPVTWEIPVIETMSDQMSDKILNWLLSI